MFVGIPGTIGSHNTPRGHIRSDWCHRSVWNQVVELHLFSIVLYTVRAALERWISWYIGETFEIPIHFLLYFYRFFFEKTAIPDLGARRRVIEVRHGGREGGVVLETLCSGQQRMLVAHEIRYRTCFGVIGDGFDTKLYTIWEKVPGKPATQDPLQNDWSPVPLWCS